MDHRAETEARLNAMASHTLAYLVDELDEFARPGEANGVLQAARLWQACFCRALGFKPSSDLTIAYGYVGTRCN